MDSVTYYYFLIITILFLSFITLAKYFPEEPNLESNLGQKGTFKAMQKLTSIFSEKVWNLFDLIFVQEGNTVAPTPIGLLWMIILVFYVYYTFHLVMLNFMTTERLSSSKPDIIQNVDDLLKYQKYGLYQPAFAKGYDLEEVMKKSDNKSQIGKLWHEIIKYDVEKYGIGIDEPDRIKLLLWLSKFSEQMLSHKKALIERPFFVRHAWYVLCCVDAFWKFAQSSYMSTVISEGTTVLVFRNGLPLWFQKQIR